MDIRYNCGNDHRFVHTKHLISDDARGMCTHKEMVTPQTPEYDQPFDFQSFYQLQIPSEEDNEISRKSDVVSIRSINQDSDLESGNSRHCPDNVITKSAVMPSHSETKPDQVVTRSGRVVESPNQLDL